MYQYGHRSVTYDFSKYRPVGNQPGNVIGIAGAGGNDLSQRSQRPNASAPHLKLSVADPECAIGRASETIDCHVAGHKSSGRGQVPRLSPDVRERIWYPASYVYSRGA